MKLKKKDIEILFNCERTNAKTKGCAMKKKQNGRN